MGQRLECLLEDGEQGDQTAQTLTVKMRILKI